MKETYQMQVIKNWNWQNRAVQAVNNAVGHIYINSPTGTGKTNFMFKAANSYSGSGYRIIIVGMKQLVTQHRKSFLSLGAKQVKSNFFEDDAEFYLPNGYPVIITTWQSLSKIKENKVGDVDILFFDECHIGGANEDNLSIPSIIQTFAPKLKVYVSATTQTSNESLLGQKHNHFFVYTLAEAYEDGLLHPVDLIEVHTGTRADISNIEKNIGKNIEEIEELQADELASLADQLASKGVEFDPFLFIKRKEQRHDSMIEIYMKLYSHAREQALFFSTDIDLATRSAVKFNAFARKLNINVRAESVHTESEQFPKKIQRFRENKVQVLFVVGMLQEGFDLASLRLGFDCRFFSRWNNAKRARFVQKIGRLIRSAPDKEKSAYYYARDIADFYNPTVFRSTTPGSPEVFMDDVTPSVVAGGIAAACDGENQPETVDLNPSSDESIEIDKISTDFDAAINQPIIEDDNFDEDFDDSEDLEGAYDNPGIDTQKLTPQKIRISVTPLYVLRDVRDHVIVKQYDFRKLFDKKEWALDKLNEELSEFIERAQRGEKRPSSKTKIGQRLNFILSGRQTDVPVDYPLRLKEAADRGGVNWFPLKTPTEILKECIDWIERASKGEKRPPVSSKEGKRLHKLLSTPPYGVPADFNEQLKNAAMNAGVEWFLKSEEDINLECEEWIKRARRGEERPSQSTKEGKRLAKLLTAGARGVPVDFKDRLDEAATEGGAKWFSDVSETDVRDECLSWIEKAKRGEKRPSDRSPEGARLGTLLSSQAPKGVLENFRELLLQAGQSAGNDWFRRRLPKEITAECEKWIILARKGNRRPSQQTPEGRRLSDLISRKPSGVPRDFKELLREAANAGGVLKQWFPKG